MSKMKIESIVKHYAEYQKSIIKRAELMQPDIKAELIQAADKITRNFERGIITHGEAMRELTNL